MIALADSSGTKRRNPCPMDAIGYNLRNLPKPGPFTIGCISRIGASQGAVTEHGARPAGASRDATITWALRCARQYRAPMSNWPGPASTGATTVLLWVRHSTRRRGFPLGRAAGRCELLTPRPDPVASRPDYLDQKRRGAWRAV